MTDQQSAAPTLAELTLAHRRARQASRTANTASVRATEALAAAALAELRAAGHAIYSVGDEVAYAPLHGEYEWKDATRHNSGYWRPTPGFMKHAGSLMTLRLKGTVEAVKHYTQPLADDQRAGREPQASVNHVYYHLKVGGNTLHLVQVRQVFPVSDVNL